MKYLIHKVKDTEGLASSTKQRPVRTSISLIVLDEADKATKEPMDYDDVTMWRPESGELTAIEGYVHAQGRTFDFAGTFIADDPAKSIVVTAADVEIPALALA